LYKSEEFLSGLDANGVFSGVFVKPGCSIIAGQSYNP